MLVNVLINSMKIVWCRLRCYSYLIIVTWDDFQVFFEIRSTYVNVLYDENVGSSDRKISWVSHLWLGYTVNTSITYCFTSTNHTIVNETSPVGQITRGICSTRQSYTTADITVYCGSVHDRDAHGAILAPPAASEARLRPLDDASCRFCNKSNLDVYGGM